MTRRPTVAQQRALEAIKQGGVEAICSRRRPDLVWLRIDRLWRSATRLDVLKRVIDAGWARIGDRVRTPVGDVAPVVLTDEGRKALA